MRPTGLFRSVAATAIVLVIGVAAVRNPFQDVLPLALGETAGDVLMHAVQDIFYHGERAGKIAHDRITDTVHKITHAEDDWSVKGFSEVDGIQCSYPLTSPVPGAPAVPRVPAAC